MPSEWTAGLDEKFDWVFPAKPDDPEMRESVSLWFFEENGKFAFPRMGIEAEASSWDNRLYQANFAIAGGRVLIGPGKGPAPSSIDAKGRASIIGAGPLTFQCSEPFRKWTARFDGDAADGTVRDQIARKLDPKRRAKIRMSIEMTMGAPAWGQVMEGDSLEAAFMGKGYRFEQLFRATGAFEVDGKTRPFKGSGLRIHRQSVRQLEGFWGHCWQSALFPSGKAFGYIAYPPRDDGKPTYNNGFLYGDGRMIAARVADAPWLRRIMPDGDDVSLSLESALGSTRIKGTTGLATFRVGNPDIGGLNLQQTGVLYEWDGERAWGMMERSAHESLTTII